MRPEIHIFGFARGLANGSYTARNKNQISRRQLYIRRGSSEILSRQCFHFQYEKKIMYIGQRVFEKNEIHIRAQARLHYKRNWTADSC